AHNSSVQRAMNVRGLPWGVQWEIVRLISLGHCTWQDVTMSRLDAQTVLNARIAPYVEDLFRWGKHSFGSQKMTKEIQATSPWQELDMEATAFKTHGPMGCLGGHGAWYGGKVSFSLKLHMDKTGLFHFSLEHPTLGPSSRYTRCYGSSWLLKVRLSKDLLSNIDQIKHLFFRPLVLNGQVFRFFHVNKDHNIYLMATAEHYNGTLHLSPSLPNGQTFFCSFLDFFSKHNNLEENSNQTIAKWAARTALGLSNSVPGLIVEIAQIMEEVDIVSSVVLPGTKHPSETDMTDGCGLINLQAIYQLHKNLAIWKEAPIAIQCRLAGAKGLLLLHPGKEENSWTHPCVWLRPSQVKIQHSPSYLQTSAHRIIDVLRGSCMQSSVQISREIIINLSENGVSPEIFADLFSQSISEKVTLLLDWDGQDSMAQLWATVFKEGGIMAARVARESSWTARAHGVELYNQEESSDDEADDLSSSHSTAWWGDDISGSPSSLEETVIALLDSGFSPMSNSILAEKLHIVAKKAVKSCMSKYRVTIPMSCSAFIVPDILGVLEEGEIHIKSSQRSLLRLDGLRSDRVIGDVLVTRSPCKLPTDIQKVKAVFKPELDSYSDVIMFSIKGPRSLASMLGTGDYDGDRVVCIWQPSIVGQFSNADAKYMEPPNNLQGHFHVENETVKEFLHRVPPTSPKSHQIQELQKVMMAPLFDLYVVGTYSSMHDNAIYSLGYAHPTTILLAWIFCTVLDGAKTGKTILRERYTRDRNSKQYGTQLAPPWKADPAYPFHPSREEGLPPFVMDVLREAIERSREEQLQRIDRQFSALPKTKDQDLIAPWQDAEARAQEMLARPEEHIRHVGRAQRDALDAIKAHVARVAGGGPTATVAAAAAGRARIRIGTGVGFTERSIERRQDQLRLMSREFVGGPPATETFVFSQEEVVRLRASYAYLYDWTRRRQGTRFPWNVAFRELGAIKLRARQDFKPISQDFYEKMMMRRL
ncbi:RNA dependent RNA polymerase-domain-containing protein, partial [Russula dissimulans]